MSIEPERDIEQDSIKSLLVYRSLYILKRKFEINKKKINSIYQQFGKGNNSIRVLPIKKISQILNAIMTTSDFLIVPFVKYSELYTADLMTEYNEDKARACASAIGRYAKKFIRKYNSKYYDKKMADIIRAKLNAKKESGIVYEEMDKPMTQYNKRGVVIAANEELKENNKDLDLPKDPDIISEDDVSILNSTQFLYCETIPLIIADYIQNAENIAIIDMNNELENETRGMFDSQITTQINAMAKINVKEERETMLKNMLYEEMNISSVLSLYENLLLEKVNSGERTDHLVIMIRNLKQQKTVLKQKISKIEAQNTSIISKKINESTMLNRSTITANRSIIRNQKEVRREEAIKEIFNFYSRQHYLIGASPTFDSLKYNEENLDLAEFTKFCIEFKILVKKNKLVELFKKTVDPAKRQLTYNDFKAMLDKLSIAVNEAKMDYVLQRIKYYKLKLIEAEEKEKKKKEREEKLKKEQEAKQQQEIKEENAEDVGSEKSLFLKKEDVDNSQGNIKSQEGNKEENKTPEEGKNPEEEAKKTEETKPTQQTENTVANATTQQNETNVTLKTDKTVTIKTEMKKNVRVTSSKKSNVVARLYVSKKIITTKKVVVQTKEEIKSEIQSLESDLKNLKQKTHIQLREELNIFLDLDSPEEYRKKMVGFNLPFRMHDKTSRIEVDKSKSKSKSKNKNVIATLRAEEIKEILKRRRVEREEKRMIQQIKEKEKLLSKKFKMKSSGNKILKFQNNIKPPKSYAELRQEKDNYNKEKEKIVSWNDLGKYDYEHFLLENDKSHKEPKNTLSGIFKTSEDTLDSDEEELLEHLGRKGGLLTTEDGDKTLAYGSSRLGVATEGYSKNSKRVMSNKVNRKKY